MRSAAWTTIGVKASNPERKERRFIKRTLGRRRVDFIEQELKGGGDSFKTVWDERLRVVLGSLKGERKKTSPRGNLDRKYLAEG
jgi:hypothetical protein